MTTTGPSTEAELELATLVAEQARREGYPAWVLHVVQRINQSAKSKPPTVGMRPGCPAVDYRVLPDDIAITQLLHEVVGLPQSPRGADDLARDWKTYGQEIQDIRAELAGEANEVFARLVAAEYWRQTCADPHRVD